MRPIEEIIKELESHPDYITSQIFTWSEFLELKNDGLDPFDGTSFTPIELKDLSESLKEDIINHIHNVLHEYTYVINSPYPHLIKNDKDEWEIENDQYF